MKLWRKTPQDIKEECQAKLAEIGYIAIFWHSSDVKCERQDLTDAQCWKVLRHCKEHHDCLVGMTFETIRQWADRLYPNDDDEAVGEPGSSVTFYCPNGCNVYDGRASDEPECGGCGRRMHPKSTAFDKYHELRELEGIAAEVAKQNGKRNS